MFLILVQKRGCVSFQNKRARIHARIPNKCSSNTVKIQGHGNNRNFQMLRDFHASFDLCHEKMFEPMSASPDMNFPIFIFEFQIVFSDSLLL